MANDTVKKRRKLTPFLCQEMLYDFALNRLDADRTAAVEDFLKDDSECRTILEGVRLALEHTGRLALVDVDTELFASLKDSENAVSLGRRYASWKEWPETLRWSVAALAISVIVASSVAVIPWHRLPSFRSGDAKKEATVVELAQLQGAGDHRGEVPADASAESEPEAEDTGSGDEEMGAAPSRVAGVAPDGISNRPGPTPAFEMAARPTPSPTPVPARPAQAVAEPAQEAADAHSKGFVYRAFMNLKNLDDLGPKIAAQIAELGGEKAGEVELGWKRGAGRYYHFALPITNEEKLLEKLRAYGPVRMSKDPHSRVMRAGQVRFILWVEPL